MEVALWVCLSFLCLQGSLPQLTHGADCTGTSQEKNCVSGQTTGGKNEGLVRLKPSAARKTHNQKQPQMWLGDDLPSDVLLDRQKRQLGRNSLLPGSFSAKGFPNTLIKVQTERARRHLGQSGTKKNKYKSRVGSFSLLSNNPSASLQVTRVRRQVQNERTKAKPGEAKRTSRSVFHYGTTRPTPHNPPFHLSQSIKLFLSPELNSICKRGAQSSSKTFKNQLHKIVQNCSPICYIYLRLSIESKMFDVNK
ncbi:uncharacterized protein LOC110535610 isoform X2 [Oncorhynchus mykiss]|uniref:uncharacterized protein LOC110535610 isoform X2 n=1 Tax=Oncorhynchus mykiss TaxID=8022 RepID=UPI0018783473|nr:uncharacterized protein LOC110535610 isoform X2 [Oncorhynchus mykiss]